MSIWLNPWSSGDKVGSTAATSTSSAGTASQPSTNEFKVNVRGTEWTVQRTAYTWEFHTRGADGDGYAGSMRADLPKHVIAAAMGQKNRGANGVPDFVPDQVLVVIIGKLNEQNR